ncbi:MAG: nucleoside triphosphate pyrophosphohydrolase [Sandaracinaceae bacterium]
MSDAADADDHLAELRAVMRRLLAPDGCPWDREQTLETLRPFLLEEAYEVVEAIDHRDMGALREELGDLLMNIVFLAELAERAEAFTLGDAVVGIRDKLVRRHPHVFGSSKLETPQAVVASWERLKAQEKADRGALDGIPVALPALLRAVRTGEKAARRGFDWADAAGAREKVDEELAELDEAIQRGDREAQERELGDVLFALTSVARKLDLDPEAALRGTLDRFLDRFRRVEAEARAEGRRLEDLGPEELDRRWDRAKGRQR